MKFMKLGSKNDSFQTDENNVRYIVTELASDIVVNIGDVKFYLHKFPLLSKSAHLQKLVSAMNDGEELHIHDIPGGAPGFEICTKFCYGMTVTLNAYNVVAARCAAEYLKMYETIEKGNLVYKVDVFLNSSIFRSWKDSIVVLQTVKSLLPLCEELKIINRCVEAIASKASIDVSKVDWSYTYNRKKLPEENRKNLDLDGVRSRMVPKDWWVEDLCELEMDFYKRVITCIKSKGMISNEVVGEALKAYAWRRLPGFVKGINQQSDVVKYRAIMETIVWQLPAEKGCVSCSFLLKLLKVAVLLDSGEATKGELVKRIGQQLEQASVNDLLIRARDGEATKYDVNTVHKIVEEFLKQDQNVETVLEDDDDDEIQEVRKPGILSEAAKLMVAKLVDGYLVEIAKDPQLPLSSFLSLVELVSCFNRPVHDGLYLAIDTFLKEHSGISKSERKRICRLIDCKKLSADASMHAAQNERLPLRVVVQVLFFEQVRTATSSGSSTPDLPKSIKDLNNGSIRSSRSAMTNTEEEWDGVATAEELKALKGELATLRLSNASMIERHSSVNDRAAITKMKGLLMSRKIFSKVWSRKEGHGETSGSDSPGSLASANLEEAARCTPTRGGRRSVS